MICGATIVRVDAVDTTFTYLRCEQLLAEARMRVEAQRRLLETTGGGEHLLATLQDSVSLLEERCEYFRKRMHLLNDVSEVGLHLVWSRDEKVA